MLKSINGTFVLASIVFMLFAAFGGRVKDDLTTIVVLYTLVAVAVVTERRPSTLPPTKSE